MSRLVLFVGGPADGRLEYVDEGQSHYEVAEYPPHTLDSDVANRRVDAYFTRTLYHLAPLDVAGVHDRRWIAYPTDWTMSQALSALLSGYARKAAVLARHAREYGL